MLRSPNILLIFTDQQRWDTLSAYGNQVIQTPNLDKLAKEGAVFENAITPCPICLAARASTISGLMASKIGTLTNDHPTHIDNRDTLSAKLSETGYHSQAIGKMHFSNRVYNETYGMDHMILSEETRGIRFADSIDDLIFDDYDRFLIENKMWGWDKPTEIGYNEIKPIINHLPKKYHVTQWCGDTTINWIKNERPKDKPFFLWTSFVKPHVPYDCPEHLQELYDYRDMPEPWVSNLDGTDRNPYIRRYKEQMEFDLYSETAAKRAKASYYANISFIDEQIGRMMKTLDEEGLTENTLVIFTSDHGDLMGDHGLWYKSFGYEGSMHIPMILRWPGRIAPETRCSEITSLVDIFPTVASCAGIVRQDQRPGTDLMEYIAGDRHCDFGVSEMFTPPNYMLHVRTKEWKYLFYQNGGYEQLYNLKEDPHELNDLAHDANYKKMKEEIKTAALEWIIKYGNVEYALDNRGDLRKELYCYREGQKYKPFSRMPWDYRIPPSILSSNEQGWFWKCAGNDWSSIIKRVTTDP